MAAGYIRRRPRAAEYAGAPGRALLQRGRGLVHVGRALQQTDARPTTRRAAHRDSRECSGRVPTRSISWAARTCAAKSVHSIACSAAQTNKRARRVPGGAGLLVVATSCGRCNMQHGLLRAAGSVAAQTSKQKHARTHAHARRHARTDKRTHTHAHARARTDTHSRTKELHTRLNTTRTLKPTHT